MARQLTREGKQEILSNTTLYVEVCGMLKVKPNSLNQLIYRNSPKLTNHDVVRKIATAMDKEPDEILEEVAEPATA